MKGVSFRVADGEIFGLLGPNGAGKSTLIRMMTTLIPVTAGRALVAGHDVSKEPDDVRRMIGVIPQALDQRPRSDGRREPVHLRQAVRRAAGAARKEYRRGAGSRGPDQVARRADQDVYPAACGAGWKSPAAWCTIRSIFFLDEPTTGLDPVSRIAVWEMLNKLKASRNLTILITTHYMEEADKLCDRIAIVDHGNLVALGTPIELKNSVAGANVIEVHFDREIAGVAKSGWRSWKA